MKTDNGLNPRASTLMPHFSDTNIFMYAAGKLHEFKEPCFAILSRVQSGELNAAIDTEVFQQILYRYHQINLPDKGADLAWSMMDLGLNVLPVTKKDIEISMYFYQQYRDEGVVEALEGRGDYVCHVICGSPTNAYCSFHLFAISFVTIASV